MKQDIEAKYLFHRKMILFFAAIIYLCANNYIQGQSWSMEYILEGDSTVYTFSQDKIIQGKPIDFFFPAYKYYHTSTMSAVESVSVGEDKIIELEFNSKMLPVKDLYFEVDLYAEGIDSIQFFLRTTDSHLILLNKQNIRKGYTYLPTNNFSVNLNNKDSIYEFKSIQIIGKSKDKSKKLTLGRINGLKKIEFATDNVSTVDSFLSKYALEKESDVFYELSDNFFKLHRCNWRSKLVLKDCHSSFDSIQCISRFTNKILSDYSLYDTYGINKQELLKRNEILYRTSQNINSYYQGMKEILASLNSCHMRLSTSKHDDIDSPLQPVYFCNIKNEITVSAIFDPTLENQIKLGDKLISINNVPISRLYDDFAKSVFASTPHQREMKTTQKLLSLAQEIWGDSLTLEFNNSTNKYFVCLDKSNFSGKKTIPSGFKIVQDNLIETYNKILYFKPSFYEYLDIPYIYSYMTDFNECEGLIIDLRGCVGGDYSFCAFLSCLINENASVLFSDSTQFYSSVSSIVKPSKQVNVKVPVVMIVDARTTCAPELFINALRKNRRNVYVMGTGNTSGSAQFTMRTYLPGNAVLSYFEGVLRDAYGQAIDDNLGIIPDKIIQFDTYRDLFPYNDKLKCLALKYFENRIEYENNLQY